MNLVSRRRNIRYSPTIEQKQILQGPITSYWQRSITPLIRMRIHNSATLSNHRSSWISSQRYIRWILLRLTTQTIIHSRGLTTPQRTTKRRRNSRLQIQLDVFLRRSKSKNRYWRTSIHSQVRGINSSRYPVKTHRGQLN